METSKQSTCFSPSESKPSREIEKGLDSLHLEGPCDRQAMERSFPSGDPHFSSILESLEQLTAGMETLKTEYFGLKASHTARISDLKAEILTEIDNLRMQHPSER